MKYADTSDEMVTLMRQGGDYDGVSASGDASNRLIAGGNVAAVDPALFPEFANVIGPLNPEGGTNNSHYVVDGYVYGVPWMYGPNFLMYNTDVVDPAPTSWDVTFEANSPYSGNLTAYDSPIFIADAAMYLMAHQPGPGDRGPVRAHAGAAGRGRRAAEAAVGDDQQVLGALHGRDRRVRRRQHGGRHRLAHQPDVREGRRDRSRP